LSGQVLFGEEFMSDTWKGKYNIFGMKIL